MTPVRDVILLIRRLCSSVCIVVFQFPVQNSTRLHLVVIVCIGFSFFLPFQLPILSEKRTEADSAKQSTMKSKNNFLPRKPRSTALRLALLVASYNAHALATASAVDEVHQINVPLTNVSVPLLATHNSHHVYIYVGSPPQRRLVIIDTGSRYLVLPCAPCARCGKKHYSKAYFDPSISTTDAYNQCRLDECTFLSSNNKFGSCDSNDRCNFQQQYTEGSSTSGFELEDIVWFGTNDIEQSVKVYMKTAVPFSFGCETFETGMIANQFADGIVGLISQGKGSIIDIMYEHRAIFDKSFSLCLTKSGGRFSLGGTSMMTKHKEVMQIEPLMSSDYYTVQVKAVFIGDIAIERAYAFNHGIGTIIDSGTTDSYLPKAISIEFEAAWMKLTKQVHTNTKQKLTFDEFQMLPNITIVLSTSGYKWVIEPHSYMESIKSKETPVMTDDDIKSGWSGSRYFVNRLYTDEENGAVLGSNAMNGHDILFHTKHKIVAIAKADCS